MPTPPSRPLFRCPRCSMRFDERVQDQIERCSYCAENHRRILAGLPVLREPSEVFPAGRLA